MVSHSYADGGTALGVGIDQYLYYRVKDAWAAIAPPHARTCSVGLCIEARKATPASAPRVWKLVFLDQLPRCYDAFVRAAAFTEEKA
jgi:hypothetical protein